MQTAVNLINMLPFIILDYKKIYIYNGIIFTIYVYMYIHKGWEGGGWVVMVMDLKGFCS